MLLEARLMGDHNMGCKFGEKKYTDDYMKFFNGGNTNFPRKSPMVFGHLAQYVEWGLLKTPPADYKAIADKLIYAGSVQRSDSGNENRFTQR